MWSRYTYLEYKVSSAIPGQKTEIKVYINMSILIKTTYISFFFFFLYCFTLNGQHSHVEAVNFPNHTVPWQAFQRGITCSQHKFHSPPTDNDLLESPKKNLQFLQDIYQMWVKGPDFCSAQSYMSCVMRKPGFCLCENKGVDQLYSNCTADQHRYFRHTDSTILLPFKSKISSL